MIRRFAYRIAYLAAFSPATLWLLMSTALAASLPEAAGGEEGLGRLFHTPAQRAEIDRQRAAQRPASGTPARLAINGIIVRSDGKTSAWINDTVLNMPDQFGDTWISSAPGHAGKLIIKPRHGPTRQARVGETIAADDGKESDLPGADRIVRQARTDK